MYFDLQNGGIQIQSPNFLASIKVATYELKRKN